MLDKLKSFVSTVIAVLGFVLGALFLWKRSKDGQVDVALAENETVKAQIKQENKQLATNNAALAKEEETRKDLQDDKETVGTLLNFFNRKQ